jgi:drug/metabolite transporter (DMT)-like permease
MHSASPVFLALVSAALFGVATPASKALLGTLPPFQLAGMLYIGAAIGVLPATSMVGWRGRRLWNRRSALLLGGAVVCGGGLGPLLLLFGLQSAPATSVSLWLNLELVATAVLGVLLFRDPLGIRGWVGLFGITVAGVCLTVGSGAAELQAGLLVAGACLCWGVDNHLMALIDGMRPTESTFWKGVGAGSVNLVLGLSLHPFAASGGTVAVALTVGAVSYGSSIALYLIAAQRLGTIRAQMIFSSAPFFGLAGAAVGLGEAIGPLELVSASLLIAALTLVFRDCHEHFHHHEATSHIHRHRHDDAHHLHQHTAVPPETAHTHWHEHPPMSHSHPHWPDLHHRHRH